jgi:hypothetical protein
LSVRAAGDRVAGLEWLAPARRASALIGAVLCAGCAAMLQPACAPGEQQSVQEMLYFGTARPHGTVSADEWAAFLRDTVTPRFPEGFTVWRAQGQWRTADGSITREDSFVLNVVHPRSDAAEQAIRAIVAGYKSRFAQESVLRVRANACVAF